MVIIPKYKIVPIFLGSTTHELSKMNKNGISMNALIEKVIATAGMASTLANKNLLTIVYIAKTNPANKDNVTPTGLTVSASLFKNNKAHPITESAVAIIHAREGLSFRNSHSINPEKIGALPIATTVPMAIPVTRTEVKNNGWNKAIQIAAIIVSFQGQVPKLIFFMMSMIISNEKPPIAKREAPMVRGCAVCGRKVWAVPVVPQRIAANRTSKYGIIVFMSSPLDVIDCTLPYIVLIEIHIFVIYTTSKRSDTFMYLTIEETAVYLSMPIHQVRDYVLEGRIKAVHDGDQFLINQAQFERHLDQVEEMKRQIDEWRNTPIPEDIDVKDED